MIRLRWLLATSLRGLWSRRVLTLGSLLLTVIAIASAVVGPSYQLTAANSFVIEQLAAQPTISTGLTYDYRPAPGESTDTAIASALDGAGQESGPAFLPGHAIVWDPLRAVNLPRSALPVVPTLVSVPGACSHVELRGRCPTNPGEIAILQADATTYGLASRQPAQPVRRRRRRSPSWASTAPARGARPSGSRPAASRPSRVTRCRR